MLRTSLLISLCTVLLGACASNQTSSKSVSKPPLPEFTYPKEPPDPDPPSPGPTTVIRNATILTAAGPTLAPGYIVLKNGLISDLGPGPGPAVADAIEIDANGKFVTPGLIDTHSHMGVYSSPSVKGTWDGNEAVRPTTPAVWAEHGFWPQDPNLWRAVSGGITTIQVLPGSANLIGGRSFIAKMHPGTSARQIRFPGAPQGLKMACGENPKRVYGNKGGPQTRMGNVAGYRKAYQAAYEYRRSQEAYQRDLAHWKEKHEKDGDAAGDPPNLPKRDLNLETLVKVLNGEIHVHNHCYRADEMHIMLDVAKEFGFKIRSFHHGLEAYKLRHRLAKEEVAVSTWADWWGFKMEAYDGIPQNAALLDDAGARAVIHSDSASDIRRLNQEAAKAMVAGRKIGIDTSDNNALRWVTANPAWALGIEKQVGTLEIGKMADVVIWNTHPFSVYALAEQVFVDGIQRFHRDANPRLTDFEIGLPARTGAKE